MSSTSAPLFATLLVAATGCAAHYAYVPQPPTTSVQTFGRDAALYEIPAQSPHGELRVISYGIEQLAAGDPDDPQSADAPAFSTLHVRVVVSNTGQKPWTLDTREQQIVLEGHGASAVAFAAADREGNASQPPLVKIFFGETRIADLFYALPPDVQKPDVLPGFRAITKIHTDGVAADGTPADDVVTLEQTDFARTEVSAWSAYAMDESGPQDVYDPDQYGYDYWDDPFWFNAGFVGFAGVPHGWSGRVYARGTGFGRRNYYHGHGSGGGRNHGPARGGGGHGGGGHGGGGHR